MDQLESRVRAWCRTVHRGGADREARVDELVDHVLCEVEALVETGHGEDEALRIATERVGDADALVREHAKIQGGLARLGGTLLAACTGRTEDLRDRLTPAQASRWIIGVSLAVAAAMIGHALLSPGSGRVVTYALVAVWWVPFSTLTAVADGGPERRCE